MMKLSSRRPWHPGGEIVLHGGRARATCGSWLGQISGRDSALDSLVRWRAGIGFDTMMARTQLEPTMVIHNQTPVMHGRVLQLDPRDNVLIALTDLKKGEQISFDGRTYVLVTDVTAK